MKKPNREKEDRRALRQKLASKDDWEKDIGACESDGQIIPKFFPSIINHLRPHDLVLDIGPGTGAELDALPCEKVVLDVALRDLQMVKERSPDVHPILGDAENLPFRPEIFDAVIMLQVVHHLPNYEKAFEEIFRVRKYGGSLLIEDQNRDAHLIIYPLTKLAMWISHLRGHYSEGLGIPLKKGLGTLAGIGFSIETVVSKGTSVKGFWFSMLTRALYHTHASQQFSRRHNVFDKLILALDRLLRRILPPHLLMWYKLVAIKVAPGAKATIAPIKREEY